MTKTTNRDTQHGLPMSLDVTPERLRILLVARDQGMRRLLASPLEADGCEVIEAEDDTELLGSLALAMLQGRWHQPANAIICDAREDTTLLEALGRIQDAGYSIPLVVIADLGDKETAKRARLLGAVAVFNTPFHAVDLRKALHQAIEEAPTAKLRQLGKIK